MKARRKIKKALTVKAWGGFSDGKLDWYTLPEWDGFLFPAIYHTRAKARQHYEDYRCITITVSK